MVKIRWQNYMNSHFVWFTCSVHVHRGTGHIICWVGNAHWSGIESCNNLCNNYHPHTITVLSLLWVTELRLSMCFPKVQLDSS